MFAVFNISCHEARHRNCTLMMSNVAFVKVYSYILCKYFVKRVKKLSATDVDIIEFCMKYKTVMIQPNAGQGTGY
jgi:hypothetical protein